MKTPSEVHPTLVPLITISLRSLPVYNGSATALQHAVALPILYRGSLLHCVASSKLILISNLYVAESINQ